MKKILLISYYFPPISNVGALRALGYAQYLPNHGWQPYVLSVKNPDLSLCSVGAEDSPKDIDTTYCRSLFQLNRITWKANSVLRLLLGAIRIKLESNVVNEILCMPDNFIGWILPAYIAGLRIIQQHNIDLIYVSSKPFSSTLTGVMLKKTTGKPLVLDFRDPASFPPNLFLNNWAGRTRQRLIAKIERFVLANTDYLLTTTQITEAAYRRRYPFLRSRIRTIYNGYYLSADPKPPSKPFDVFTIVYLGNFYYNLLPSDSFFAALHTIIEQGLIPNDQIRFLYVGKIRDKNNWLLEVGRRFGIKHLFQTTGHVSRGEAQAILKNSAIMLLRIVPPMISTKLFEALRDGIPMLAIIEKGEVETLIKSYSPQSFLVTTGKSHDVVDAILGAYHNWKNGKGGFRQNNEYIASFSKAALTSQFANILDHTIKQTVVN